MGNERRYFYDYYMLCCGPIALGDRVANPDRAVAAFGTDGALDAQVLDAQVLDAQVLDAQAMAAADPGLAALTRAAEPSP
jgi:hypothetical protein